MKRKQRMAVGAGLVLALGITGLLTWRERAKMHQGEAAQAVAVEPPLAPVLSPEDQGYVACPEDTDLASDEETGPEAEGASCLANLLPWALAPAPFHAETSLTELESRCGSVFADFLFYRGEGRCQWGTAMYHGSDREVQITWHNWTERKKPRSLRFVGTALYFENGVRPGMLLKDLAAKNGQSIRLAGFGWDESGVHRSFQKGQMQAFDEAESPYQIQYALDWNLFDEASEDEHARIVVGDAELESTEPALEKFRAHMEYVEYRFFRDDRSMGEPFQEGSAPVGR